MPTNPYEPPKEVGIKEAESGPAARYDWGMEKQMKLEWVTLGVIIGGFAGLNLGPANNAALTWTLVACGAIAVGLLFFWLSR